VKKGFNSTYESQQRLMMLPKQAQTMANKMLSSNKEFLLECNDHGIGVYFNKSFLDRTKGLYNNRSYIISFPNKQKSDCITKWYDSSKIDLAGYCHSSPNDTISLSANFSQNCGINYYTENDYIVYNSTIIVTYGHNPNVMISREEHKYYNVMCRYNRTVYSRLVGENYNVTYEQASYDSKNSTSEFDFSLQHTDMNGNYKSTYNVGDYIQFSLSFNTKRNELKGVIQKCWATSDGSQNEYVLIKNRCSMEEQTSWVGKQQDKLSIFKTEVFRYVNGNSNGVYLECMVQVCLNSDQNGKCSFCQSQGRKRRDTNVDNNDFDKLSMVKSSVFYIIDRDASNQTMDSTTKNNMIIIAILSIALLFISVVAVVFGKKVFGKKVTV